MAESLIGATATSPFVDVPVSHPFVEEIVWLAGEGISTGWADGTFRPAQAVSRQAMAAFLWRAAGEPEVSLPVTSPFVDVPVSHQFYAPIVWLAAQGISTGWADGTFRPSASITREAMAAFLFRFDHTEVDTAACSGIGAGFPDVADASVFCEAIRWMASVGPEPITTGWADGTFRPKAPVTRGAMAAYLYRYRQYNPVPVDSIDYTVADGVEVPGEGQVAEVTPSAGEVPLDADGSPTGEAPDWSVKVTLGAGATVPEVGQNLLVEPGDPAYPDGVAGVVIDVSDNGDGTTTVTLAPVALDEVFTELHIDYSGPVGDGTLEYSDTAPAGIAGAAGPQADATPASPSLSPAAVLASTGTDLADSSVVASASAGLFDCTGEDGLSVSTEVSLVPSLTFENTRVHYQVDLGSWISDPFVLVWIATEPVVRLEGAAELGVSCTLAPAWARAQETVVPIGATGATVSVGPYLEVGLSAASAIDVTQRLYWMGGFQVTTSDGALSFINTSSADPVQLTTSGEVEISVGAGLQVELGVLDRAGFYGKAGLGLTGTAGGFGTGEVCATAYLEAVTSLGVFLDVWVARWEYQAWRGSLRLWDAPEWCFDPLAPPDVPLAFTTISALPAATAGEPYAVAFGAKGGTPPYAFELASGSPDLPLTFTGETWSGTPAVVGTYAVDVTVHDGAGDAVTRTFTLTVDEAPAWPPGPTLVSLSADGSAGAGDSYNPSITSDGRWIAFDSNASDIVAGDTNNARDVFLRDRTTGQTIRVSAGAGGTQADDDSGQPSISDDGRWIAFASSASNLVDGDTNGLTDIFVWDRTTGVTTRVSTGLSGASGDDSSYSTAISSEGRWIAFDSFASNLVAGDTNGAEDVFLWDRLTAELTLVSSGFDGGPGNSDSFEPNVSADGRWVAYTSYASNLVEGDVVLSGNTNVFLWDRTTGETIKVSAGVNGTVGGREQALSADGTTVAYIADTSTGQNLRVWDRATGEATTITDDTDGLANSPTVSSSGRWVAYMLDWEWFVFDRSSDERAGAVDGIGGAPANGMTVVTDMSPDGEWLTYFSAASNLVPGDTNGAWDVFVSGNPLLP